MLSDAEAQEVLANAELICSASEIETALDRLALSISERLQGQCPLLLPVMAGAIVFAGQLLPRLKFPLEVDYIHATRYRGETEGGQLIWKVRPRADVRDRVVLVVDDILDEGHTLAAVKSALLDLGAKEALLAVFCEKALNKPKPIRADFVGVSVPDRYVFGFGMDVNGAWRNLNCICAKRGA